MKKPTNSSSSISGWSSQTLILPITWAWLKIFSRLRLNFGEKAIQVCRWSSSNICWLVPTMKNGALSSYKLLSSMNASPMRSLLQLTLLSSIGELSLNIVKAQIENPARCSWIMSAEFMEIRIWSADTGWESHVRLSFRKLCVTYSSAGILSPSDVSKNIRQTKPKETETTLSKWIPSSTNPT